MADSVVNAGVLIAAVVAVVMFPLIGATGQRFGRRRVFIVIGALSTVAATAFLGLAIAGAPAAVPVIVFATLALVASRSVRAMISALLMEMLPTEVRSSGYGIAYSLPSVIPAFCRGDDAPAGKWGSATERH